MALGTTCRHTELLTFAPGVTSLPFVVTVLNDRVTERPRIEDFTVFLRDAIGATIDRARGQGKIVDDDGPRAWQRGRRRARRVAAGDVGPVRAQRDVAANTRVQCSRAPSRQHDELSRFEGATGTLINNATDLNGVFYSTVTGTLCLAPRGPKEAGAS